MRGTGEDAIYFANKGYRVHATDISTGMLDMLQRKARLNGLDKSITQKNVPLLRSKLYRNGDLTICCFQILQG
jgi:cyclopropane fatty-acyl-phospholipid synthase-like methyltransferase